MAPATITSLTSMPPPQSLYPDQSETQLGIIIDDVIYYFNLYFKPVGQPGRAPSGYGITLSPNMDDTCLTLYVSHTAASIVAIQPNKSCQLSNFNAQKGSLDVLVPLSLEVISKYGGAGALYNTELTDSATPRDGPKVSLTLGLSTLKIMTGSNSTTYSKYGFYSDTDQAKLDQQANFTRTQTGRVLKADLQTKLTELGADLDMTLADLSRLLYYNRYYELIDSIYRSLFGRIDTSLSLKVDQWYRYRQEHGVKLF